jgi:hypothetical protein
MNKEHETRDSEIGLKCCGYHAVVGERMWAASNGEIVVEIKM